MDLVEIAIMQAEQRKAQQQLMERRRAQWREEGAKLMERRLNMGLTATFVASEIGIDVKRLRRLERGEPVREPFLLRKSYENVLAYQDEVIRNEQLVAEVAKLRSQLQQTNVIVEVNGHRWSIPAVPTAPPLKKRSVI